MSSTADNMFCHSTLKVWLQRWLWLSHLTTWAIMSSLDSWVKSSVLVCSSLLCCNYNLLCSVFAPYIAPKAETAKASMRNIRTRLSRILFEPKEKNIWALEPRRFLLWIFLLNLILSLMAARRSSRPVSDFFYEVWPPETKNAALCWKLVAFYR